MRIKVINYTKDHKGCKFFIHLISQDSFTLFINIKFTKKTNQNSKHTPKQGANSLQKLHIRGHNYMPKSGFKITPQFHKKC